MNVICKNCKAKNRVAEEKLAGTNPICGKCKETLTPNAPGLPVEVNDESFRAEVLQAEVPVLLDLWGPSCPPCRQLAPVLDKLAFQMVGRVKVAKLNVETHSAAAAHLKVRGIPTLILYQEGQEVSRTSGFQPLEKLSQFVQQGLRV